MPRRDGRSTRRAAQEDWGPSGWLHRIRIAWRWVKSNPEANFKAYCRERYTAFQIGAEPMLKHLAQQLADGSYRPESPEKIFVRKPAGMLRPLTILTVRDQIVYQALALPVAEHLYARYRDRYLLTTFGNRYAGSRNSLFFYDDWRRGYRAYNAASWRAHSAGFRHLVTFDLTACYDSIDHRLLCEELNALKVNRRAVDLLRECLECWTEVKSTDTRRARRHGHGIPQGPLASGIVAEVLLQHFDGLFLGRKRGKPALPDVRFLRYVDDIRIFGKSYSAIDEALRLLDRRCKDLGLFPQKSKIDAAERPIDEQTLKARMKSVSTPPEEVLATLPVNQESLRARLRLDLDRSPESVEKSSSPTRLKYLLAQAEPDSSLTDACIRFLGQPGGMAYLPNFVRYLMRYRAMTGDQVDAFIRILKPHHGYESVLANMFDVLALQPSASLNRATAYWWGRQMARHSQWQADLGYGFVRWRWARDGDRALSGTAISKVRHSWLARSRIIDLAHQAPDHPNGRKMIEKSLGDSNSDLALAAAWWCIQCDRRDLLRAPTVNALVGVWLQSTMLSVAHEHAAHEALQQLARLLRKVDWPAVLGIEYPAFARSLRRVCGCWDTDVGCAFEALATALALLTRAEATKVNGLGAQLGELSKRIPIRQPDGRLNVPAGPERRSTFALRDSLLQDLAVFLDRLAEGQISQRAEEVVHV